MSSIDDPIEAVRQQFPDERQGVLGKAFRVFSPICDFAGILDAVRQQFSDKGRDQRVNAFFDAFEFYIRRHEGQIEELHNIITKFRDELCSFGGPACVREKSVHRPMNPPNQSRAVVMVGRTGCYSK